MPTHCCPLGSIRAEPSGPPFGEGRPEIQDGHFSMQHFSNFPLKYDVLVFGAGPAGAATAMLLARAGASVFF